MVSVITASLGKLQSGKNEFDTLDLELCRNTLQFKKMCATIVETFSSCDINSYRFIVPCGTDRHHKPHSTN